jgi:hypothetical protein
MRLSCLLPLLTALAVDCSVPTVSSAAQSIFAYDEADVVFEGQPVLIYDAAGTAQPNPFLLEVGDYHDASGSITLGDASESLSAGAIDLNNDTGVGPVDLTVDTVTPIAISGFGYAPATHHYSDLSVTMTARGFTIVDPIGTEDHIFASAPEPASWSMLLIGVGAIGAALRRDERLRTRAESLTVRSGIAEGL